MAQEVFNSVRDCREDKKTKIDVKKVVLCVVKAFLRIIYLEVMVILSLMVTSIITEVGKVYGGVHRPWFLQACNPDFSSINCTDRFGNPLLISEDVCRPNSTSDLLEARKSWPSGHASTIFCGMVMAMVSSQYVCVCMYYVYVCMCVCVSLSFLCVFVCTYMCMYVRMYLCISLFLVCLCVFERLSIALPCIGNLYALFPVYQM